MKCNRCRKETTNLRVIGIIGDTNHKDRQTFSICDDCYKELERFLKGSKLCSCHSKIENKMTDGVIKTYYQVFNSETGEWETVEYPDDEFSQR